MSTFRDFDNTDNIIDSRDVIAKIRDLESTIDDMQEEETVDQEELETLQDELKALQAFADEASGAPDWEYGEALIRDSYFEDYARELAEDIGAIDKDTAWPARCIDWVQAAEELQSDYMSAEYDGVTYWIRA